MYILTYVTSLVVLMLKLFHLYTHNVLVILCDRLGKYSDRTTQQVMLLLIIIIISMVLFLLWCCGSYYSQVSGVEIILFDASSSRGLR